MRKSKDGVWNLISWHDPGVTLDFIGFRLMKLYEEVQRGVWSLISWHDPGVTLEFIGFRLMYWMYWIQKRHMMVNWRYQASSLLQRVLCSSLVSRPVQGIRLVLWPILNQTLRYLDYRFKKSLKFELDLNHATSLLQKMKLKPKPSCYPSKVGPGSPVIQVQTFLFRQVINFNWLYTTISAYSFVLNVVH